MRLGLSAFPALAAALGVCSACTFYTNCPDGRQQPAPNGSAGSGTNGGGSNGNSGGNSGGSGGDGPLVNGGEAPSGQWTNETLNLADLTSECGNVSFLSAKPSSDVVLVSVAQQGLWSKAASDSQWQPLGQGEGSAMITNRGSYIAYDPDDPNVFWESGIYNGAGVYRTDDGGDTFVEFKTRHNDGVSVDFTDPERKTLLATVHEQPRALLYSGDRGETWQDIGANLPESAGVCPHPLVLDGSTFLLGCGTYGGGMPAIYRSEDAGQSWEKVSDLGPGGAALHAADGTIYWSGEGTSGVVRSEDQGKTWLGPFASGLVQRAGLVELPDGRIAALGDKRVLVSSDKGERWREVTTTTNEQPIGIAYSSGAKAFYAWRWTCDQTTKVPSDAVLSYAFDFETE